MGKQEYYISQAIQEALKSDCKHQHGAVCVKGGKIIARGHNYFRTLRVFSNGKNTRKTRVFSGKNTRKLYTCHAEMAALLKVRPWENVDLYVIRLGASGLVNSRPCRVCQRFISSYRVARVFYSE